MTVLACKTLIFLKFDFEEIDDGFAVEDALVVLFLYLGKVFVRS